MTWMKCEARHETVMWWTNTFPVRQDLCWICGDRGNQTGPPSIGGRSISFSQMPYEMTICWGGLFTRHPDSEAQCTERVQESDTLGLCERHRTGLIGHDEPSPISGTLPSRMTT